MDVASVGAWAVWYLARATGLMALAGIAVLLVRGPGRRVAVVRAAWAGLVCLAAWGWVAFEAIAPTTHAGGGVRCTCCDGASRASALGGAAYGAAAAGWAGWLGLGAWARRRLLAGSRPAPGWLRTRLDERGGRGVRLRVSEGLAQPLVTGATRPVIVVPTGLESGSTARVEAAIGHELAHVRHGDLAWLAVARGLGLLLAAHPLYWWLRAVADSGQEALADAAACEGVDRAAYAEALVAWARRGRAARVAGLGMARPGKRLRRRVERVLGGERPAGRAAWRWRWGALAAGLALGGSLAAARPEANGSIVEPALVNAAWCAPAVEVFGCSTGARRGG
jgi:hypothetical protein